MVDTLVRWLDVHGCVVTNEGSVCVLRRTSAWAVVAWLAVSVVARSLILRPNITTSVLGVMLLAVSIASAASAIESWRQGRHFPNRVTHILSDVVRRPTGEGGSGADLVARVIALAGQREWSIGGTAANEALLAKFYVPLGCVRTGDRLFRLPQALNGG